MVMDFNCCIGFTIRREDQVRLDPTELSQQMQPVPPVPGGSGPNHAESRPIPTGSQPSQNHRVLRLVIL